MGSRAARGEYVGMFTGTALPGSLQRRTTVTPVSIGPRKTKEEMIGNLLPVTASPSKGQLLLAITIASQDHKGMPAAVKNLLRAAAGGVKTSTFPAGLDVPRLAKPVSELSILEDIGLAPSSTPTPSSGSSTVTVDGNVDANNDAKNESFVQVSPHEATVKADVLNVRASPSMSAKIVDTVKKRDKVQVMGTTLNGTWSLVDHGGTSGYMGTHYLQ